MKGVDWGKLYNAHKDNKYDTDAMEAEIVRLMMDEDAMKKPGIYEYVLTREEKYISIRAFTDNMKREAYERQPGVSWHVATTLSLARWRLITSRRGSMVAVQLL